jgi:uncharacterized membrane protein YdjX (TVP38/TMEM64 family)
MKGAALRFGLLVVIVGGGAALAHFTPVGAELDALARRLAHEARAPWAAPAYIGLYALALAVGLPGTLLTVVGGATFGMAPGLAVNLAGALLGAAAAFLEARYLARSAARRLFGNLLARVPPLSSDRAAVWAFFRLRMIAVVPYNGLNFAAGLTDVRLLPYLAGTALGIVPSTTLYTGFAAELARGGTSRAAAVWQIAVALTIYALIGIAPTLLRGARRI